MFTQGQVVNTKTRKSYIILALFILPLILAKSVNAFDKSVSDSMPEIFGANLNETCDKDMYDKYIRPMYVADNRQIFVEHLNKLKESMNGSLDMERKSCFLHRRSTSKNHYKFRFLDCRGKPPTCQCCQDEPFKSKQTLEKDGYHCRLEAPTVGSPCRRDRTEVLNNLFYNPFRNRVEFAKKPLDIKAAIDRFREGHVDYWRNYSLLSDFRTACFYHRGHEGNVFNPENLECSSSNKCVCVRDRNRFNYNFDGSSCVASKNTICKFQMHGESTTNWYTFSDVKCVAPFTCRAVPMQIPEYVKLYACQDPVSTHSALFVTNGFIPLIMFSSTFVFIRQ